VGSSGPPQTVQAPRLRLGWRQVPEPCIVQVLAPVALADLFLAVDVGPDIARPDVVVAQEPGEPTRIERLAAKVTHGASSSSLRARRIASVCIPSVPVQLQNPSHGT
jgi:hypothetical protein